VEPLRSEAQLRESEARFRRLFDQSPIGVGMVTLDFRFVRVNEALCRFLGYREEELLGRTFVEITHPDNLAENREQVGRLARGEIEQYATDKRYLRKDGSAVWGHLSLSLVRDGKTPLYFVPMIEDISERRRAEEELRLKTEEMERYFTLALDLLCIADTDGHFRRLNPLWETTLGFELGELVGARFLDLVHPDDLAATRDAVAKLARGELVFNFTNRYRCKDGAYRWIEWRAAPYAEKLIYAVARDITERIRQQEERERLEEQLRQSQRLESIGRLAGGVAHDFNNLLTGITGNISLALLDLRPEDPLHATLIEINKAAESAAGLTRQLLAFSRKQLVAPRVIDPNELIGQMQKMLVRLIGEDIELRTVLQRSVGRVRIDPGQLEQVLVNLAVNARDAMPDGGVLRLETADVRLDEAACQAHPALTPGEHVVITVADTGSGISDEVRQHIFEPFFTTKPKEKGTGLGLATVYGAIKQAGGAIELCPASGRGTTFRLYLPRVNEQAEPLTRPGATSTLPTGSETILLVEDEPIVKELARRLLDRLGYKVLSYLNAGEALLAARRYEGEIHLLLTDVVMPGMNGKAMAEELLALRPGVRVLFTSGYTEEVIAQHGVLDEGIHFIGKPYSPQQLALKLREVLGPRRT